MTKLYKVTNRSIGGKVFFTGTYRECCEYICNSNEGFADSLYKQLYVDRIIR